LGPFTNALDETMHSQAFEMSGDFGRDTWLEDRRGRWLDVEMAQAGDHGLTAYQSEQVSARCARRRKMPARDRIPGRLASPPILPLAQRAAGPEERGLLRIPDAPARQPQCHQRFPRRAHRILEPRPPLAGLRPNTLA